MNDEHEVSAKAAIYSTDGNSVLVMQFPKPDGQNDIFGLPGGHIDAGEGPVEAIARELSEELGITVPYLRHADFFLHRNGKIVLAYTGVAPKDLVMYPGRPEFEYGVWKTREEIEILDINQRYKTFVLENWPDNKGAVGYNNAHG